MGLSKDKKTWRKAEKEDWDRVAKKLKQNHEIVAPQSLGVKSFTGRYYQLCQSLLIGQEEKWNWW